MVKNPLSQFEDDLDNDMTQSMSGIQIPYRREEQPVVPQNETVSVTENQVIEEPTTPANTQQPVDQVDRFTQILSMLKNRRNPDLSMYDKMSEDLKSARSEAQSTIDRARSEDDRTKLFNTIKSSIGNMSQGLANRAGYTDIKVNPQMIEANQENRAGLDNKDRMSELAEQFRIAQAREKARSDADNRQSDEAFKLAQLELNRMKSSGKVTDPFEKAQRGAFAKQSVDYFTKDRGQLIENSSKVSRALELIKNKDSLAGPVRGSFPDVVRQMTNPDAITARELVQSAITDTLRPTLGAQFTEKEGERIMNLQYNERGSDEENARRAEQLQKMIDKKVKFSDEFYKFIAEGGQAKDFDFAKYGMTYTGEGSNNELTGRDKEAYDWAIANPNDPRSAQILKKLGR